MQRRRSVAWISWSDVDGIPSITALAAVTPVLAAIFARWGIPRVDPMWLFHWAGVVGPSCGLTRAVVALARREPGRAWRFNPAGYVVFGGAVVLLARAAVGLMARRWLVIRPACPRLAVAGAAVAFILLWVNQQSHAAYLLHHVR